MRVRRVDYPASFLSAVEPLLLADEARHNLMLGLLRTLIDQPDAFTAHQLWHVEDVGHIVGAAMRTPPHNLVLAAPRTEGVLDALVEALAKDGVEIPGVIGGLPEAEEFATLHVAASGIRESSSMTQGIYALTRVEPVATVRGVPRPAEPRDLDLALEWFRAFMLEAGAGEPWDEERARVHLRRRIAAEGSAGLWLWDDGEVVSLAGFGGPTPSGIRVGPVYTPPERRGRGYATGLVAALSAWLLGTGRRFCFLYTDMANPTSNAIYRRIGYRLVCESAQIAFGAT